MAQVAKQMEVFLKYTRYEEVQTGLWGREKDDLFFFLLSSLDRLKTVNGVRHFYTVVMAAFFSRSYQHKGSHLMASIVQTGYTEW